LQRQILPSRKSLPPTPEPSGVLAATDIWMLRSRVESSAEAGDEAAAGRCPDVQKNGPRQGNPASRGCLADLLIELLRRFRVQDRLIVAFNARA